MKPKFFDIHSHLNFPDFDKDRDEVIKRALNEGIWMINVGTDYETSKKAVEIAEKYQEGVYASVGLHPHDAGVDFDIARFRELANHPKVVAIGECGLEFPKDSPLGTKRESFGTNLARQKEIFEKQIELALEVNKPLMIHCRDAHDKVIDIVSSFKLQDSRLCGNIHFFSGTWEQAQKYFDLGFTVSFTGVITFAAQYDGIIKNAPADKIMAETDAPFVAPTPYRGKRNEPLYIQKVVKRMAEIRSISYKEISQITAQNALRLFLKNDRV